MHQIEKGRAVAKKYGAPEEISVCGLTGKYVHYMGLYTIEPKAVGDAPLYKNCGMPGQVRDCDVVS